MIDTIATKEGGYNIDCKPNEVREIEELQRIIANEAEEEDKKEKEKKEKIKSIADKIGKGLSQKEKEILEKALGV